MGARDRKDLPPPSDLATEAATIERVLARLEAVERELRGIDRDIGGILDGFAGSARPNPRRAHELLTTAVNAVSAAERRLRRRLVLDREESARGSAGRE